MFYTFSLLSIRAGMQEVDKKSLKYVSGKCERQRFADGRSFWYLFAFRVGVNESFFI